MATVPRPIDTDDLIKHYTAGEGTHSLAKRFHVNHRRIRALLRANGIKIRTRKMPLLDADDIISRYAAGISLQAITLSYGLTCSSRIKGILINADIPLRNGSKAAKLRMERLGPVGRFTILGQSKCKTVDDPAVVIAEYVTGVSANTLAKRYNVTHKVIDRILSENGVRLRTQSEAEQVKVSRMTQEQRDAMTARMREGFKNGHKPSWRINQALSFQANLSKVGKGEAELMQWLRGVSLNPVWQQAIDAYNIDIGLLPIAVELYSFSNNPLKRATDQRKIEYLTNCGIHVLYIVHSKWHPVTADITRHIIAFLEEAKSDPSPIGQYRVIRGCGNLMATGRGKVNNLTIIPATCCPENRRQTRYWSRREKAI